jgi:hypothetical protein
MPYTEYSRANWTNQFYGEYRFRRLQLDSEFRHYLRDQMIFGGTSENTSDVRGWYVAGSFRILRRLQFGSYDSHYELLNIVKGPLAPFFPSLSNTALPSNHIYDKIVTARIDLTSFWNLKIDGHFMNGYAFVSYPDGF